MNNSVLISTAVATVVIVLFMWQGYRKGALSATRGLLCSLSGYLAAYSYAFPFTEYIRSMSTLVWLPAFALSSVLLFLFASVVTGLLLAKVRDMLVILREGDDEHDPYLGLATGAVAGAVMSLLLVWVTGITLDAMHIRDNHSALVTEPADPVRTVVGQVIGGVVEFAVEQKIGKESIAPELVGKLVANPMAVGQQLTQLSHNESTRQLFTDPALQALLSQDNIDQLQQQTAFHQLMQDPVTSQLLSGLSQGTKAPVPATKEKAVASLLVSLWQKSERIKADPRFDAIMRKPEIQALLANPSPLALLGNHDIQTLAEIAFSNSPQASSSIDNPSAGNYSSKSAEAVKTESIVSTPASAPVASPDADAASAAAEQIIYRWTDKDGHKHFSQTKPEGDVNAEEVQPR